MRLGRTDRGRAILSRDVVLIYEPINLTSAIRFQSLEPWATADPDRPDLEEDGCDLDNWAGVR